jgi:hypothetical protein
VGAEVDVEAAGVGVALPTLRALHTRGQKYVHLLLTVRLTGIVLPV